LREKGQKFHQKRTQKKESPKKNKKTKSRKRQVPDHEEICGYWPSAGRSLSLDHLADGSTESPEVGSFLVTEKEPRQRQMNIHLLRLQKYHP
jgi:hypothetical protein